MPCRVCSMHGPGLWSHAAVISALLQHNSEDKGLATCMAYTPPTYKGLALTLTLTESLKADADENA